MRRKSPMAARKIKRSDDARVTAAHDAAAVRFTGRVLDARPDRLDFRDLPYRPPLRSLEPRWPPDKVIAKNLSGYIEAGLVRDQGDEGACTGFGLTCVANYLRWVRHVETKSKEQFVSVSPRMIYELARRYDEWPGVDYKGSSCRGALKGWNKHGVCAEPMWPYTPVFQPPKPNWERDAATRPLGVYYRVDKSSVVDLQAALNNIGAVYVSANVHDGWDRLVGTRKGRMPTSHHALPVIGPAKDPKSWGGHAFALVSGNDGVLNVPDVTFGVGVDPEPYATKVVVDTPRQWFAQQPARAVAKLIIYAHGGLNSEEESIKRIRVLAPYAEANGIYP